MIEDILKQLSKVRESYDNYNGVSIEDIKEAYEEIGIEIDRLESEIDNLKDNLIG